MRVCDSSHVTILRIHALASHLGTLDEAHEEPKDVMLEPNLKMVFGGPILKMEGPLECMPRAETPPR